MSHPAINIILFLLLASAAAFPQQTLGDIAIAGSTSLPETEYLRGINLPAGSPVYRGIADTVRIRTLRFLNSTGFYHATAEVTADTAAAEEEVYLQVVVEEGLPTYIHQVSIASADSALPEPVTNALQQLEDEALTAFNVETQVGVVLDYFDEHGYPFAEVRIHSVAMPERPVNGRYQAVLNLTVDRGRSSSIDHIEIVGNLATDAEVLLREIGFEPGMDFSQEFVDAIPEKLNRLRFFDPVRHPEFFVTDKNEGMLQIKVKEINTNSFDGVIGYVPGYDNEDGFVTGQVNVSLRNLFGTGRAALIKWEQLDRLSQQLELRYLEPWVFSWPVNITLGFLQKKQDSAYVKRNVEGEISYRLSENFSLAFLLSSESVIPSEQDVLRFTVFNSTIITTGVRLRVDSRDSPYAPTRGVQAETSFEHSRKTINGPDAFITPQTQLKADHQRLVIDAAWYYELFENQVVAIGLHGRELSGGQVEISDMFRFGGANTLRGYRENQFIANRIAWTNLEYRLLLSPRTYTFAFFDAGYYDRRPDPVYQINGVEETKFGFGAGINFETSLGILGVSFALASGDTFGDGKIHFGIVNDF